MDGYEVILDREAEAEYLGDPDAEAECSACYHGETLHTPTCAQPGCDCPGFQF